MPLHRYTAHYVAAGDGVANAAAEFGFEFGLEATADAVASPVAAFGFEFGLEATADAVASPVAAFGFEFGLAATVEASDDTAEVEAAFGFEFGLEATVDAVASPIAEFGFEFGLEATVDAVASPIAEFGFEFGLQVTPEPVFAEAAFGLEFGLEASATPSAMVRAAFGFTFGLDTRYIGPGSGVEAVPVPPGDRDPLRHVREGDVFRVLIPWAGIEGLTGTVTILGRGASDNGFRQVFEPWLVEELDPRSLPGLRNGRRPSYQPTRREDTGQQQQNIARRSRELARRRR